MLAFTVGAEYNPPLFSRATSTSVDLALNGCNRIWFCGSARTFSESSEYIRILTSRRPQKGVSWIARINARHEHRPRQSFAQSYPCEIKTLTVSNSDTQGRIKTAPFGLGCLLNGARYGSIACSELFQQNPSKGHPTH